MTKYTHISPPLIIHQYFQTGRPLPSRKSPPPASYPLYWRKIVPTPVIILRGGLDQLFYSSKFPLIRTKSPKN